MMAAHISSSVGIAQIKNEEGNRNIPHT